MKSYRSIQTFEAGRIVAVRASTSDEEQNLAIETDDGSVFDTRRRIVEDAPLGAVEDGYLLRYPDGHFSIWRAADFEGAFRVVEGAS